MARGQCPRVAPCGRAGRQYLCCRSRLIHRMPPPTVAAASPVTTVRLPSSKAMSNARCLFRHLNGRCRLQRRPIKREPRTPQRATRSKTHEIVVVITINITQEPTYLGGISPSSSTTARQDHLTSPVSLSPSMHVILSLYHIIQEQGRSKNFTHHKGF